MVAYIKHTTLPALVFILFTVGAACNSTAEPRVDMNATLEAKAGEEHATKTTIEADAQIREKTMLETTTQALHTFTPIPTPVLTRTVTIEPTVIITPMLASPTPTATPKATPTPIQVTATPMLSTASVTVRNFAFVPMTVTVTVGETVTWNFVQGTHTTTGTGFESWNSGNKNSGSFSHTFNSAGTFAYVCNLHSSMTGTVIVD